MGLTGGSGSDTLDPHAGLTYIDTARFQALYSPLVQLDGQARFEYVLAESMEPDHKSVSQWIIRLRPGVTFQARGNRAPVHDRVTPLVQVDHLGQQLGARPVPLALDGVDQQFLAHIQSSSVRAEPCGIGRNGRLLVPGHWPRRCRYPVAATTSMFSRKNSTMRSHRMCPRTPRD